MLAFPHVMDLFADEFAGLCGRGFPFALVLARASEGFLLGHDVTSRSGTFTQRPFQNEKLVVTATRGFASSS